MKTAHHSLGRHDRNMSPAEVAFWRARREAARAGVVEKKYDPDQPRVRAGFSNGGQFARKLITLVRATRTNGGTTYHPISGDSPRAGMVVAIFPERSEAFPAATFSADDIQTFIDHNHSLLANPDFYIGTWADGRDKIVLDVDTVVDTDDEAKRLSDQWSQEGYYDLAADEYRPVNPGASDLHLSAEGLMISRPSPQGPARIVAAAGSKDLDRLFPPGGAEIIPAPWWSAGKRKDRLEYDADLVHAALDTKDPQIRLVDPTGLRSTQPSITRAGVAYYLDNPDYYLTGETYADGDVAMNKYPVIYRRFDGQDLILSGHHRAAAAALLGTPLRATVVDGPWGVRPNRGTR